MRTSGNIADGAAVFSVLTKRANAIIRAGNWQTDVQVDTVSLDYDRRFRRRLRFITAGQQEILLDLPEAAHIRGGDALVLEDGSLVRVDAAPELLLEIRAADADALARLAWHLGNRHLGVQFTPGALRILYDHVIAEMVTGLGGQAERLCAAFDPESGAYAH